MATTPSITLKFKLVTGAPLGAFGPAYKDITREGAVELRFKYIGKRAATVSVQGHAFFRTRSDATAAIASYEAAKGKEVYLRSELDNNQQWRVFVMDVACPAPQAVVTTLTNRHWKVSCQLQVVRTA